MRTLRFGIEIETVGQTRERIAWAIQAVVGGTVAHVRQPSCYDPWKVTDRKGRVWSAVADGSLSASRDRQAEVVSPVLTYEDIPELQEVVRAVRRAGARVDETTAIHVHVDAARFDTRTTVNLVKIINKQERLIEHALGISDQRRSRSCRSIDPDFVARLEQRRPRTLQQLRRLWYGRENSHPVHYDSSRYRGVNLHNIFYRGTIELRWFQGTLHAGKIKAYVQFVLAIASKALKARAACSKKREFNAATARYDFRVFLLNLGLVGEEFKTARLHLLAHLEGSAAWKHGRPAATAIASAHPEASVEPQPAPVAVVA